MRFLGGPAPRLAVATNSEQVKVLARGGSLDWQLLHGHSRVVLSLDAFVPPPPLRPLLVSSSKDHTIRVWGEEEEGSEGRSSEFICKGVGSGHTEAVGAVAFGRSGFTVHLPASHIASSHVYTVCLKCVRIKKASPHFDVVVYTHNVKGHTICIKLLLTCRESVLYMLLSYVSLCFVCS